MAKPRFGQSFPVKCAVQGCDGNKEFSQCEKCGSKTCGKHHPQGLFAAFKSDRCPICGSTDVKKL